jgi:hypothetical protein
VLAEVPSPKSQRLDLLLSGSFNLNLAELTLLLESTHCEQTFHAAGPIVPFFPILFKVAAMTDPRIMLRMIFPAGSARSRVPAINTALRLE